MVVSRQAHGTVFKALALLGLGKERVELVAALIERRAAARADRDWVAADAIRDSLADLGVTLEDGPRGTTWHRG